MTDLIINESTFCQTVHKEGSWLVSHLDPGFPAFKIIEAENH